MYVMVGPDLNINDAPIPLRPLQWDEIREFARLVRASAIVDLEVKREQGELVAHVERLVEPRGSADVVLLPALRASNGVELAAAVASRIVSDSELRRSTP